MWELVGSISKGTRLKIECTLVEGQAAKWPGSDGLRINVGTDPQLYESLNLIANDSTVAAFVRR
jgi:hypothetical protein